MAEWFKNNQTQLYADLKKLTKALRLISEGMKRDKPTVEIKTARITTFMSKTNLKLKKSITRNKGSNYIMIRVN